MNENVRDRDAFKIEIKMVNFLQYEGVGYCKHSMYVKVVGSYLTCP